jgi:hypothetical protein
MIDEGTATYRKKKRQLTWARAVGVTARYTVLLKNKWVELVVPVQQQETIYFDSHCPSNEKPMPKDRHCMGKISDA